MHTRKCKQKIVEINVNKHWKNLNIGTSKFSLKHLTFGPSHTLDAMKTVGFTENKK